MVELNVTLTPNLKNYHTLNHKLKALFQLKHKLNSTGQVTYKHTYTYYFCYKAGKRTKFVGKIDASLNFEKVSELFKIMVTMDLK